jgi:hypothetical protein
MAKTHIISETKLSVGMSLMFAIGTALGIMIPRNKCEDKKASIIIPYPKVSGYRIIDTIYDEYNQIWQVKKSDNTDSAIILRTFIGNYFKYKSNDQPK